MKVFHYKHFWIFPREKNCRMLIGLWKEVFMNHPIKFLDGDKKTKLVPASFSDFLELLWEKNKFYLKRSDIYSRYNLSTLERN